ncbi:MAG: AmmeMemoRadiSam system protein B [Candidatus Hydrogenedentota bacterium]|nr:MAG: AmmeMemoRadiSam system protein B [Candidatus Hydrogenedentota bacterium]
MQTRKPIVAGQFYPGQHYACVDQINECLDARPLSESLPDTIVAGIVPHAGWTFSGVLAALVFSAIRQQHEKVHTFVLFGAAHSYFGHSPALCDRGVWETPLGDVALEEEMADALLNKGAAISDANAHMPEHSIEVQVPFIQYLFAGSKILPILVPPTEKAIPLGTKVGEMIAQDEQKKIICLGSTDLTHYGPRYGFMPQGMGEKALAWAKDVNDKKFIDAALKLDAVSLLTTAVENGNACGPGATAATVAAAKALGCQSGVLLEHTTSNEIMIEKMGSGCTDAVGYAAMIF